MQKPESHKGANDSRLPRKPGGRDREDEGARSLSKRRQTRAHEATPSVRNRFPSRDEPMDPRESSPDPALDTGRKTDEKHEAEKDREAGTEHSQAQPKPLFPDHGQSNRHP